MSLRPLLETLLEAGSVPASRLSPRRRAELRSLFDTGILQEVREGAGRRVCVRDRASVEAFARSRFPDWDSTPVEAPARARSIARHRDAKRARTAEGEVVLLRGQIDGVIEVSGVDLPVGTLTQRFGVASLLLQDGAQPRVQGRLAVVENLEAFLHYERLGTTADLALYARGRLSARVLKWLGSDALRDAEIVHCGDYDPVGLDEYRRLRATCGDRARLFVPEGLEDLLRRYGKATLLTGQSAVLRRLRSEADPDVKAVVVLLDRYGYGLEQEALLL
jgi:hypothetical protein